MPGIGGGGGGKRGKGGRGKERLCQRRRAREEVMREACCVAGAACPPENLCSDCDEVGACSTCLNNAYLAGAACLCDTGFFSDGSECRRASLFSLVVCFSV